MTPTSRAGDDGPAGLSRPAGWLAPALLACVAVLSLLWPLCLTGSPYIFADSTPYLRGAATGFDMVLGWESDLVQDWRRPGEAPTEAGGAPAGTSAVEHQDYRVGASRSIYFGSLAFLSIEVLGPWGLSFVTAAVVLLTLGAFGSALGWRRRHAALVVVAAGLLTPLPFFTNFLMPDIYAGLTILAAAAIFVLGPRLARWHWLVFGGVLVAACMFHTSHLLLLWGMTACGTALALLGRGRRLPGWALATAALATVAAIGGQAAFGALVERTYGAPPVSPPFLAARLIADGPGYRYLLETCDDAPIVFCDYLDRMPGERILAGDGRWYSDPFLWSPGETGVFRVSPAAEQARMSEAHLGFARDVFLAEPAAVIGAILDNAVKQVRTTGMHEFKQSASYVRVSDLIGAPAGLMSADDPRHAAFISGFASVATVAFWVSLALAAGLLAWRGRGAAGGGPGDAWRLAVLIGIGLAGNALITGGLSGPHDRYQARVLWLGLLVLALATVPQAPTGRSAGGRVRSTKTRQNG